MLYAVYGELITERAGRINLGMEGCLLMGACFGFLVTVETGSAGVGVLAGMAARRIGVPNPRLPDRLSRHQPACPPAWR